MKKLMIVSAIAISGLMYQNADAQIGLHFNINLGPRPVVVERAPVYADASFYYLPDVDAYYSVSDNCYYYQDGDNWVTAAYLPGLYRDYDWQHARHFAVNEPRPYLHNDVYRARYGGFDGRRDWNRRDNHNTRVYADRAHFDNNRADERSRFDNNRNDHQQPQPQNNGNRNDRQQQQPQNNDHGNNNRADHNNRQGRSDRF